MNKLDKDICKGARLNGEQVVGLKIGNRGFLYETTGPDHLNIYTIRIPHNTMVQATVYDEDNSSRLYENNYKPSISWGEGVSIKEDESGQEIFKHTYNTSSLAPGNYFYKIKTTCKLEGGNTVGNADLKLPGDYIVDIGSVRIDYREGASLFAGYSGIKTVREPVLERLKTINFTSMSSMFENCYSIEKLNLVSFNTSKVTDMTNMFNGCSSLQILNLSSFDTGIVANMSGMFNGCGSLTSLDLSSFYTPNVTSMSGMFYNCTSLEELNLSNFDTSKVIRKGDVVPGLGTAMTDGLDTMLRNCTALHTLILDGCSKDTINDIITSAYFPTDKIANVIRIIYCEKEVAGDLAEPTNWKFSFNLEEEPDVPVDPPTPEEPEEPEIPLYQAGQFEGTDVKVVTTMVDNTYTNLANMFKDCTSLTSVNVQDWDVSNVRSMVSMFSGCASLTTLDLNNWNVSKLDSVDHMFYNCTNLTSLDLSNWNAISIGCPREAFYNCNSLTELDLSSWKPTITGTDGCEMFAYCSSLEVLDIRNFYIDYYDSEEDYVVRDMFEGCNSLRTLYLNNCNAYTLDQILAEVPYRKSRDGVIYCKKANMRDEDKEIDIYNPPSGWRFEYID
jgi:surface protein